MTDDIVVRISDNAGSGRVSREMMERETVSIVEAIQAFERDGRPYWVTIESSEQGRGGDTSLIELVEMVLLIVASQKSGPRDVQSLAGLNAVKMRDASAPRLKLKVSDAPESINDPAGTLLIDKGVSSNRDGLESWITHVHRDLASNVLARADAEYAVTVDIVDLDTGHDRVDALLRGLSLARSVVNVLPAEIPGMPNLADLRVRVLTESGDAQANPRVRVWRLGFMKIPGRSRIA